MHIRYDPTIEALRQLALPTSDYAIFGSGPMFAYGLISLGHDVDVIARGKAWERALEIGIVKTDKYPGSRVVELLNGQIEVTDVWFEDLQPGMWNVDELIDTAVGADGIRFVTLDNVAKWKKAFGRPKDLVHIKLIETYLDAYKQMRSD
jgi:hypothetical protein